MSVDKKYCMSSYLAFRFIDKNNLDFFEGLHHIPTEPVRPKQLINVNSAEDIDLYLKEHFKKLHARGEKLGIMLSGGMDSACLASYMPGCDAYTFRFLGGSFQDKELKRAEYYAEKYKMNLHYVDISWEDVLKYLPIVVESRKEPVHSIEPQIYKACLQAKKDGVESIILGECADSIFGGLDRLLSHDWEYQEFIDWFMFVDPKDVLVDPADVTGTFEPFRKGNKIDYVDFMQKVYLAESAKSYSNVFSAVEIKHDFPYSMFTTNLDLDRIRSGDSKYLIRELFNMKYPDYPVPDKNPMPRPVDKYFENWNGPVRKEFKKDINMDNFTGNQKWLLWCLEWFLNKYEK